MTRPSSLWAGVLGLLLLTGLLAGCTSLPPRPVPPLLLISMDGFRWDYCTLHPAETPHLRQLMREGISARALIPVFPSNTYPNHYAIATGLYPSHHDIINNQFFDPVRGELFHYNVPASSRNSYWWGGEPIWITAVRQGRRSASSDWVGGDAEIDGARPTYWKPYDYSIPFEKRLDELMGWLDLPADRRPAVIAFYLEETNSVGHTFGPDSPEITATIKLLDARIGAIMDRLQAGQLSVNLLIVSDHGMTAASTERVVLIDDYVDLSTVQVDFEESIAGLRPLKGDVSSLVHALAALPPHFKVYRTEDLPARFHVSANPRNPPVWVVPEEGWEIERRALFNNNRAHFHKGQHGYDPAYDSMHGILIAHGPSFKTGGVVIDPVENIQLYNLMCAALHLTPAPNDGDDRLVRAMLR